MIYLASPYSHPEPAIREQRYRDACQAAARLMSQGELVFSPIAHSHGIAAAGIEGDWKSWSKFDQWFLDRCSSVVVLTSPGWEESKGIKSELVIAERLDLPVSYWDGIGFLQLDSFKDLPRRR